MFLICNNSQYMYVCTMVALYSALCGDGLQIDRIKIDQALTFLCV